MNGLIIIFAGTLTAAFAVALALLGPSLAANRRRRDRVAAIRARAIGGAVGKAVQAGHGSLKRTDQSAAPMLDKVVTRWLPRPALLNERLTRAGLGMGVGMYVLVCLALGMILAALAKALGGAPTAAALLSGLAGGLLLPHFLLARLIARRQAHFTKMFPDAIDLMVRGVKSGLPVTEGIAAAGREIPAPVGTEFRAIAEACKFGTTLEDALWQAADRIGTAEFKFFVVSLVVQSETGGNLAETLSNLSDILRKRQQMALKVKAMASEARASAMILGSLPFVMVGILLMVSPDYITALFTDPRGRAISLVGLLSMGIGVGVMAKMVRFEI